MKIYMAGGIFFLGDKFRNDYVYNKLKTAFPEADIYDPLQNTDINGVEGKKKFADAIMIAKADNDRLDNCDVLVACIDGDVLPSGTCAEIGKFHEKIAQGANKLLIGLCTDNRQCYLTHSLEKDMGGATRLGNQQYSYQNLYVTGLIMEVGHLVSTIDEALEIILNFKENEK